MSVSEVPVRTDSESTPDLLSPARTLIAMGAATAGGAVCTLAAWFLLHRVSLPAFSTSQVTRALSTATVALVLAAVFVVFMAHARLRAWPRIAEAARYLISYLAPAAIVVGTLAVPLSATRLYLEGTMADQGFRSEFLTRMASTWHLQDMAYIDLPTYYPAGWFWPGGRLANLLGIPGWEVFQPWAIVSLAAGGCLLVPVWQRITGSLFLGTAIALTELATILYYTPEEPYAALVALGAPAAVVLAGRAVRGGTFSLAGVLIYLGLSASTYTLFTGVIALTVIVLALTARTIPAIVRLAIIGFGSMAIAAIFWGPYFLAILSGHPRAQATAMHYLPEDGARLPVPFLSFTVLGLFCLIGVVYLVLGQKRRDIASLGTSVLVTYGWMLLSMLATLKGTTLLGFRLDVIAATLMATAGVFGAQALYRSGWQPSVPEFTSPAARSRLTAALAIVIALASIHFVQGIPRHHQSSIDLAYTMTDGYGERGDRFPADSTKYEALIDGFIKDHGYSPTDTVIHTDEITFTIFHPYHSFQAFTSHYANPLGEFERRNEALEKWAKDSWTTLSTPEALAAALDAAPWRAPDAFILRGDAFDTESGWKFHIAEDIYPSNPNVRFRAVYFNPRAFLGDATIPDPPKDNKTGGDPSVSIVSRGIFDVARIGPYVVVVRAHH